MSQNDRRGFTLAEVLVTLAVIGVVASLTIPGLMKSYQKSVYVSKLKKNISVVNQAFNNLRADNDGDYSPIVLWQLPPISFATEFSNYLKVNQICHGNGGGCAPDEKYIGLDGSESLNLETGSVTGSHMSKIVLLDGTIIFLRVLLPNCGFATGDPNSPAQRTCGDLYIDVNGKKAPNQYGRDMYFFYFTRDAFIPFGAYGTAADDCNTGSFGTTCAKKILEEGAMNY